MTAAMIDAPFVSKESTLRETDAIHDEVLPAGRGWSHPIAAGQTIRIVDLEGNQAVDTLFYNNRHVGERYSAVGTPRPDDRRSR